MVRMSTERASFSSIDRAVEELRAGRFVVVVDDEDRENEGDLVLAAEKVTPEAINFMAREGRGLICLALTEERCDELARPGHMFPLRAQAGGVLKRAGQTEASVDLARIAGLHPSAVICEVMNA